MGGGCEKTVTGKILENILFLAELFGAKGRSDISDVPVLELARCFELAHPTVERRYRRRSKMASVEIDAGELSNN